MGQLEFFSFSSGERSRTGGRCPPDPLGFFALQLETAGACRAGITPARPAVYKPPVGAQVASPQSPILRWSTSRLSEVHPQTRGSDKSLLLIARLLLLTTNCLLLLTQMSPFARPATPCNRAPLHEPPAKA